MSIFPGRTKNAEAGEGYTIKEFQYGYTIIREG